MEAIIVLATAFVCVCCFIIGAKVAQTIGKGEDIEMPTVSPFKAHREREARKEAQMAQERVDTILHNIDNYDGTAQGQKDVPRG